MDWKTTFGFKNTAELLEEAKAALVGWQSKLVIDPNWGTFYDFLKSLSWLIEGVESKITALLKQAFIQHSTDGYTDEHAVAFETERKKATKTRWVVTLTRSNTASPNTPAGTWVGTQSKADGTNLRFRRIETKTAAIGQATLDILCEAEFSGPDYNVGLGTITKLTGAWEGWDSCTNQNRPGDGFLALDTAGSTDENDASLIARSLARWDERGTLARDDAFAAWALEVAPNVQVELVKGLRGPGTIDMIITGTSGEAPATLIAAIQANVNSKKASTDDVLVRSIVEVEISVAATLYLVREAASRIEQQTIATVARQRLLDMFSLVPKDGVRRFAISEPFYQDRVRGEIFAAVDAIKPGARSRLVFQAPITDRGIPSGARWKLISGALSVQEEAR